MMTLLLLLILAFGGFTVLLVISISIVEAPWPVLLGILVTGLLFIQWVSGQGRAIAPSSAQDSGIADDMSPSRSNRPLTGEPSLEGSDRDAERIYRGIRYAGTPSATPSILDADADVSDSVDPASPNAPQKDADEPHPGIEIIEGVYRGRHWQRERSIQSIEESALPDITYRGRKLSRHPPHPPSPPVDTTDPHTST